MDDFEKGEVVEVHVLFPPYSMTEDSPKGIPAGLEHHDWIRATVDENMASGLVWLVFGRKLEWKDLPPDASSHYVGIYNCIVHRNMIRRLNPLDRIAAET